MENNSCDNITFRVTQRRRANSLEMSNLSDSSLESISKRSLSHQLKVNRSDSETASLEKIEDLEKKLESANNEIDNLLIENTRLIKEVEIKDKVINMYKMIESNEGHATPIFGRKRKKPRLVLLDKSESGENKNDNISMTQHDFCQSIKELEDKIQELTIWYADEKKKTLELSKKLEKINSLKKPKKTKLKCKRFKLYYKKIKTLTKKIEYIRKKCLQLKEIQTMENLGEEHLQKRQDFIKFSDNMENKYTNNENQKNQEFDTPSSIKLSKTLHKEPNYM